MADLERRSAEIEVRAKGRKLEGYAALFNVETTIGGSFSERIAPGAFQQSLTGDLLNQPDILALIDHDVTKVLGRTRSRTLRLSEDSKGLGFEVDVPDTTLGRDLLEMVTRGDVGGMSFGFISRDDDWRGTKRELRNVDLREISVVSSWPAYEGTIVNARSWSGRPPSRVLFARRYLDTVRG